MADKWIAEPVYVFEDGHLSLSPRFPCVPPDQLSVDRLEESFYGGVIIAITLAAHRDLEAMLAQYLLMIV